MKLQGLITNKVNNSFYHELINSLMTCSSFDLSIAFITYGGLQVLLDTFNELEKKGIRGRIITTNYMYGTEPKALRKLLSFKNIEVNIYDSFEKGLYGFHTKGYIFYNDEYAEVIVGSSNLTNSALKTNQEWNVRLIGTADNKFKDIKAEYEYLWNISKPLTNTFINKYEKNHFKHKVNTSKDMFNKMLSIIKRLNSLDLIDEVIKEFQDEGEDFIEKIENTEIILNELQEEGIASLNELRRRGETKALVIAATGTGKTYLSAFDVSSYNPNRLLFIAHSENILEHAHRSFRMIMPNKKMGMITGTKKDFDSDYIFSTNLTMSNMINSNRFNKDYFDYIIIDEAHKSSADTYMNITNHFEPKFLLGMTATPERTDSMSIFETFDRNIAIEVRLRQALGMNLIVPFHYFGINDISTDMSKVDISKIDKVAEQLSINKRVDLIIEHINLYEHDGEKTKCLGFCVNTDHARFMAKSFNERGISSIALTGEDSPLKREIAIKRLEDDDDDLSYIFSVNIFNEGVDIPSVNLVLMLRPTESPIIFTQQLGRGLRKFKQKQYLTVLDFIGNHNKTFLIPMALYGDSAKDKDDLIVAVKTDFYDIPGETFIRLDPISKERILKQLEEVNFNSIRFLKDFYFANKKMLMQNKEHIPFVSIDTYDMDGFDPVRYIKHSGFYLNFVSKVEDVEEINNIINDEKYIQYLSFLDKELPLKQPVVFILIDHLLKYNSINKYEAEMLISKKFNITRREIEYAFNYLKGDYFSRVKGRDETYGIMIDRIDDLITLNNSFKNSLKNEFFKVQIQKSINYGLNRYFHEYKERDIGLSLYHNYSRTDIAYLIKYDNKASSFANPGGLFLYNNEYYLFVNLDKKNVHASIDYEDKFISNRQFQWESPNITSIKSNTGQNLIYHKEKGIKLHLFVRKNKTENSVTQDFTYFGELEVESHENEKPIKFIMNLKDRVPDNIYNRFIVERKDNEEENRSSSSVN